MARRCTCSRLLDALRDDPRLRTLPLATRMLWLLLADAMARFEGVLPFGDARRVSLLVSEPVTDVETHLETLIAEGLLVREGAGLASPLLREAAARTSAARENGRKGGRPRRGESAEEAARRRQGELLMPVGGVGAKPSETQPAEPPATTTTLSVLTSHQSPVAREGWQQLGQEVVRVAGLTARRIDWTPARDWLGMGASADLVLRVVVDVVARAGFDAARVSSLRYFTPAIERALRDGVPASLAAPAPPFVIHHDSTPYLDAVEAWEATCRTGPRPRLEDYRSNAA